MHARLLRSARTFSLLTALLATLMAAAAHGLPRYGPLEISGNISAQELIRTPDTDTYSLVQQRNQIKVRVDYAMLDRGRLIDKYDIPFIERAKMLLLYRGVYDSVYDLTPGFAQTDIYGKTISQRLESIPASQRNAIKFDNQLREAYMDIALKTLPLSFRLGKQQIVWGETDNFRLLDRVNPLDLTWHLQQESWDELRIPFWMIKGLWDFGQVGPLSSAFFEFYWNPGDWNPAKQTFLPRPWGAPITNPLTGALSRFGKTQLAYNTKLFDQGNYTRDPGSNSQVGARVSAVTPQGVQFTLNYFYQRWAGSDDGTDSASVRATDPNAVAQNQLPIEFFAPYVHTAGFSLNYAEEEYTQAVYRMESVYEFGVPFNDASKPSSSVFLARDVFGVSKRDMWNGMLAFDRPTWIRAINRNSTILILGQFFWHYMLDNPNIECTTTPSPGRPCGGPKNPQIAGFRGTFSTSGLLTGTQPFIDKVRDWEALTTLAATTFYHGGKIVPLLVYILDPVNSFNMEVLWAVDYFITNDIILNLSQRYFINTVDHPVFETWGIAGINRGRSETGLRLTYQF